MSDCDDRKRGIGKEKGGEGADGTGDQVTTKR